MAKTHAALAAALIRKELKAAGIEAKKVTSENYSMGSNVNVTIIDATPETKAKAETICKKYQAGHFDGMIDCYEYSNSRDDIPQAKFVFVRNEASPEMKQRIYDWLRGNWHDGEKLPALYDAGYNQYIDGVEVSAMVHRCFTGAIESFWKPRLAA